ncbi:unnamed protein product [Didymodactylos carnosus]|uniref:Uncharacterized protein n=1 Tax=Didymodactylos carnosus TaxID=1234261 RepID=A0A815G9L6_9BILA|nr:unnamed protein product [Didymodactylos carnosus]CAF1335819.1 unnamed protein product [Didymodactylos carnosus]CAF4135069.1 unnamed protein product [Didymodactylos carnosus]CAF4192930.1 unnamed protein product [Didymodactylos carnosus]
MMISQAVATLALLLIISINNARSETTIRPSSAATRLAGATMSTARPQQTSQPAGQMTSQKLASASNIATVREQTQQPQTGQPTATVIIQTQATGRQQTATPHQ